MSTPRRISPAAEALRSAITAHPAGITVFVLSGVERAAFMTEDVARLLFGATDDPDELKRQCAVVRDYRARGLLRGRQAGRRVLFPGDAVADFLRWLGNEDNAVRKTA